MDLFPHNELAYSRLVDSLKGKKRVSILQPTGTGKSYIIAKLIISNLDSQFLYISSSNYILHQFIDKFKFARDNTKFITYHSLLFSQLEILKKESFDYIILDEFQRAGALQWKEKVVELLNCQSQAEIVGITATHIRTDFNQEGEVRDMVKELFDGNVAHHLSLGAAFASGILPAPKYVKALYNIDLEIENLKTKLALSGISDKRKHFRELHETKIDWEKSSGISQVLKKHITTERNFIIFCKNIESLNTMKPTVVKWFRKAFAKVDICTYVTHSKEKKGFDNLQKFKKSSKKSNSSFNLLFSVDQLNEGIHVPNIEGEIFLRNTSSHLIFHQQWGRSLETKGSRTITFDLVNNFSKNILIENYSKNSPTINLPAAVLKHYEKYKCDIEVIDETLDIQEVFRTIEDSIDKWNISYAKYYAEALKGVLSQEMRQWEQMQKDAFKAIPNSPVWIDRSIKLDAAEYFLGYNWKNGPDIYDTNWSESYKKYMEEARTRELTSVSRQWEHNQKAKYNPDKKKWAQKKLLLDKAEKYLGYNWLKGKDKNTLWLKTYKKYLLQASGNKKLDTDLKKWENSQAYSYRRNPNSNLWKFRKPLLDDAEVHLGYNWLDSRSDVWNKKYDKYFQEAKKGKLSRETRDWELQQKYLYNRDTKGSESDLWKKKEKLLNKTQQFLGYNWRD